MAEVLAWCLKGSNQGLVRFLFISSLFSPAAFAGRGRFIHACRRGAAPLELPRCPHAAITLSARVVSRRSRAGLIAVRRSVFNQKRPMLWFDRFLVAHVMD
jgi:hypothetical protein